MRSLLRRGRLRSLSASLWALLLTSTVASLDCVWRQEGVALRPGDKPRVVGFQRVTSAEAFRWAAPVTKRICELETISAVQDASTTGAPSPPSAGWTRFEGVPNRRYTVVSRTESTTVGMKSPWLALLVKDDAGSTVWLRNTPGNDDAASVAAWRCVVDESLLAREALTDRPDHVELAVTSGSCGEITPILGGLHDLTSMPYTVAGTGLYAGRDPDRAALLQGSVGAVSVGLQLESDGGTRRLTVPLDDFKRCFVRADHPPPLPREAAALTEWLATPAPDQTDPPGVAFDAVRTVAGIDSALCSRFPMGKETGLECRMPVVRWEPESGSGPYGPSRMVLVRDRVVDAFHLVGEKLVPAEKAIRLTAIVRMRGATGTAFAAALDEATKAASGDPALARERAKRGFRLLRERDAPAGTATHAVELEVAFNIPELETTTEHATHVWSAGKKRVHNEAYDVAQKALEQARHDLESRTTEAKLLEEGAKKTADLAAAACKRVGDQLGFFGGLAAGAACSSGASALGDGVGRARVTSAAAQLAQAEQTANATPQELEIDDQRTYEYESTVLRRRGEARATVSVHPIAGAVDARAVSTVRVPFDARDVETPASPEHKLEGHKASPPTPETVQATLAKAMVPLVDAAVQKWADEHRVGGDVGSLQPGSRSWLVSVARRAANDRYVKLLADVEESRADRLAKPYVVPITIPEGSPSRCFTIAASPSDRSADVNLEVAAERGEAATKHIALVARDRRTSSDAGVDLCGLPPGRYAASVTFAGEPQGSVQIALFDSTPSRTTRFDTELAVRSLPTAPPEEGAPTFDGSGVVKFKGSAGAQVVGMAGDRDGDGVTDDLDRCPSDPETKNGYLDGDGCPDDAPSGAPPVGVAAKSAPPLAVDAPNPTNARASAEPPGAPPVKKQPWWLKPKVPAGGSPAATPASPPPALPATPTEQPPAAAPAPPAASTSKALPWWLKPKAPAVAPTTTPGAPASPLP